MRRLWQKAADILLTDAGQTPPPGYIPIEDVPPVSDTFQYTYRWKRADGTYTTGRYNILSRYAERFRPPGRYGYRKMGRQPRDKTRRALQARLYRLRNREYWYRQRASVFDNEYLAKKIKDCRKKIKEVEQKLLTRPPA